MKIEVTQGRFSHCARSAFPPGGGASLLGEDLLSAAFVDKWYSVLVTDDANALLHVIAPSPIADTGYCDIEPWFGYGGPQLRRPDPAFARAAFLLYSQVCREHGVVTELIRFDALHPRYEPFLGWEPLMRIVLGKPIAYVRVAQDDEEQMRTYKDSCRRTVRTASNSLRAVEMGNGYDAWQKFIALHYASLDRRNAARHWYFTPAGFERLRRMECVSLWGTFPSQDVSESPVSTAVVVQKGKVAYYFLAANGDLTKHNGANDFLIHEIVRALSKRNVRWFCLGGGNGDSLDDSLLAFKRKFAACMPQFPLGFVTHNPEALAKLLERSTREIPAEESTSLFLRYRLAPSLSAGRYQPCLPLNLARNTTLYAELLTNPAPKHSFLFGVDGRHSQTLNPISNRENTLSLSHPEGNRSVPLLQN